MARSEPFAGVVADMDGVLTRTASVHARAWKHTFDELLARIPGAEPFSDEDYRRHVDGKPRRQGIVDFLKCRGIELPEGAPSDSPDMATVEGIAKRKNARFGELLEREGVGVFRDAVAAVDRWRRGDLPVAVVSASKNCRRVLEAAGIADRFDAVADGQVAVELGLEDKAALMKEAARRLSVPPRDLVVIEDATAGVRAGRRAGFGRVIGVDRTGHPGELYDAGADEVVDDVFAVRFVRRLPGLLDRLDALEAWRRGRPLSLWLCGSPELARRLGTRGDGEPHDTGRRAVLALGDGEEAEPGFASLGGRGLGVRIGEAISTSGADYRLASYREARRLLEHLGAVGARPTGSWLS